MFNGIGLALTNRAWGASTPTPAATPTVEGRTTGVSAASNLLTYTPALPASIAVGELLVVAIGFDASSSPTLTVDTAFSGNNWTQIDQQMVPVVVGMVIYYKIAQGSDALRVNSTGSEQFGNISWRISHATSIAGTFSTQATAAVNADPPSHTFGGAAETLWLAVITNDGDTAIASAAPTGYSNLTTRAASAATGCTMASAEKTSTAASENPGVFTTASQEWIAATLGVRA
jgi:hypothetical protein